MNHQKEVITFRTLARNCKHRWYWAEKRIQCGSKQAVNYSGPWLLLSGACGRG